MAKSNLAQIKDFFFFHNHILLFFYHADSQENFNYILLLSNR